MNPHMGEPDHTPNGHSGRTHVAQKVTLRGGPCDGEERMVSWPTRTLSLMGSPVPTRRLARYDQLPDDPRTFRFVGLTRVRMGP